MKLFLNSIDNEVTWNKKRYLLEAAKRLGITDVIDINSRIADEPTDFILNIEPYSFIRGNKWTGIWDIDLLCDRPQTGIEWPDVDVVFLAVPTIPKRLEHLRHKTQLLFQACDPTFHKRVGEIEADFVGCGTIDHQHTERDRLNKLLRQKYSFKDFGKNHTPQKYVEHISKGRIQFIRSMNTGIAQGELAQRFFECLAIGPVLTDYVDYLPLTGLIEGVDYLSYKNDEELFEKFQSLRENENFARSMAENGRKKALLYHTYEHRLITILHTIHETHPIY